MNAYITLLDGSETSAIDYPTLAEAKQGLSMEVWYAAQDHGDTFTELTPLEDIVPSVLDTYGEIVYGRFGNGTVLSIREA